MKKEIVLLCIGLFAAFSTGCITDEAVSDAAENHTVISPQGKEMPANTIENLTPPFGSMNATRGSMEPGSTPPGPGADPNATDDRAMPPGTTNGTPGSMGPGSLPPGDAPQDRPDMNRTGIPLQGITGA